MMVNAETIWQKLNATHKLENIEESESNDSDSDLSE